MFGFELGRLDAGFTVRPGQALQIGPIFHLDRA